MSEAVGWKKWCDNIEASGFVAGGIYGHDGAIWAEFGENGECKFSNTDINNIKKCMAECSPISAPIHVNGVKQTLISANENQIVGKFKTDTSIIAEKCNQCIMVGVAGPGSEPRNLSYGLNKLAENLKESGY